MTYGNSKNQRVQFGPFYSGDLSLLVLPSPQKLCNSDYVCRLDSRFVWFCRVLCLYCERADRQLWAKLDYHLRKLNRLTTIDLLNGALEDLESAGIHAKLFCLLQTPGTEQNAKTVKLSTNHLNRCIATIQVAKLLSHEILDGVSPQSTSYVLRVS